MNGTALQRISALLLAGVSLLWSSFVLAQQESKAHVDVGVLAVVQQAQAVFPLAFAVGGQGVV